LVSPSIILPKRPSYESINLLYSGVSAPLVILNGTSYPSRLIELVGLGNIFTGTVLVSPLGDVKLTSSSTPIFSEVVPIGV
jgi:hypothetical protein